MLLSSARAESESLKLDKDETGDSQPGDGEHRASGQWGVCERLASVVKFVSILISSCPIVAALSMGSVGATCFPIHQRPDTRFIHGAARTSRS